MTGVQTCALPIYPENSGAGPVLVFGDEKPQGPAPAVGQASVRIQEPEFFFVVIAFSQGVQGGVIPFLPGLIGKAAPPPGFQFRIVGIGNGIVVCILCGLVGRGAKIRPLPFRALGLPRGWPSFSVSRPPVWSILFTASSNNFR